MKREEKSEHHAEVGNNVENEVEMSFTSSEQQQSRTEREPRGQFKERGVGDGVKSFQHGPERKLSVEVKAVQRTSTSAPTT